MSSFFSGPWPERLRLIQKLAADEVPAHWIATWMGFIDQYSYDVNHYWWPQHSAMLAGSDAELIKMKGKIEHWPFMTKIVSPLSVRQYKGEGRWLRMYIKITTEPFLGQSPYLSIVHVTGPTSDGNALGGCGALSSESIKGYEEIMWHGKWMPELWNQLVSISDQYHLRRVSMIAPLVSPMGRIAMPDEFYVPDSIIEWLKSLPDTDRQPAWRSYRSDVA